MSYQQPPSNQGWQPPPYPPSPNTYYPPQEQNAWQTGQYAPPPPPVMPPQNIPPYPQQRWQLPPPKGKNPWLIIALFFVMILLVSIVIGAISNSTSSTPTVDTTIATAAPTDTPIPTDTPVPTQPPTRWTTTHTFTGSGNKKTSIFAVPDDWKILWKCNQSDIVAQDGLYNLQLDVYNSDGTNMDLGAVNELCKSGNTSGETEEHQSGNVYLDITSEAGWVITVQENK